MPVDPNVDPAVPGQHAVEVEFLEGLGEATKSALLSSGEENERFVPAWVVLATGRTSYDVRGPVVGVTGCKRD